MYSPTTRLLTILDLLQSRGKMTGPDLAEKLEVSVRSVRRYITMLRDLGIPVESEPGRYGEYYLRPGFRLPPLMFTCNEILAITLGLVAVRHVGLSGTLGLESATAKIERVLPDELREQARALQGVLSLDMKPHEPGRFNEDLLAKMSLAAYQNSQVWLAYGGREITERTVDVYGIVHNCGQWYAVGYCHLRQELRNFRLDRILNMRLLETTFTPPENFDPLRYLWSTIATVPSAWHVEVLLDTTMEVAQAKVPPNAAVLEQRPDGVLLYCQAGTLDWAARFLVSLNLPLRIITPPELRDELRRLAEVIVKMASN